VGDCMRPNNQRNWKYVIILFANLLIFIPFEIAGASTGGNTQVSFDNSRLTVHALNCCLRPLLAEIKKETGIKFYMDKEEAERVISVSFQSLPIEKALIRILNKVNYAIIFGSDGNAQKVIVMAENKTTCLQSGQKNSKVSIPPNTMPIVPPSKDGMEITHSSEPMIVGPPSKDGMEITHSDEPMIIGPPGKDGMKITHPTNTMVIDPPVKEGMKTTHPPIQKLP